MICFVISSGNSRLLQTPFSQTQKPHNRHMDTHTPLNTAAFFLTVLELIYHQHLVWQYTPHCAMAKPMI